MLDQVRVLLKEVPFAPFKVKLANGSSYDVPSSDHAWITPGGLGGRLIVGTDDGLAHIISPVMIVEIESLQPAR
ncbi:MAG: hypothetical protein PHC88_14835 [Terrimicrobiaceae bacterium]|nr:hypothetical protein [Terrimicrobiaceae bacterium]